MQPSLSHGNKTDK